jgi:hypothetical protein
MKKSTLSLTLAALLAGSGSAVVAQSLPTTQPKFLNIIREQVKIGRGADHARFEVGYPAAFEKGKSAQTYLAMVSTTGNRETWYVTPFESHAALEEANRRQEADPVLSAEIDRLDKGDAEFLSEWRSMQARARPDLTHGDFPELAKARYFEITVFRVKPGYESGFASVAKSYAAAAAKVAPKARWRTYEVMAGAPGGTFLVFSSMESLAELDQTLMDDANIVKAFSGDELLSMQKFSAEGLVSSETNRYRLDPQQSYVPREVREKDPAFWMPKPPAKPAAKAPEKKP